jgi:glyoxylase-like metal-dependent hydrolase (beta-lactamase superfamily II)
MTEDALYEVVIARYGTRTTTRSEVYLNHPLYHEPDGPIGMDYFVWVIRNASRTILVDTGFSTEGGDKRARTMVIHPREIWAELGITPDSAPPIVLTHAHYDHTGNLDHFPQSRIVVAQSELDFWNGPHAHRVLFHHSVEDDELAGLRAAQAEGRVETFSGSRQLAPGVEVIEIGGHTPGQSVVLVQTSDGPVLLASDAVHYLEELERDMLFTSVADLTKMYAGFDTITALRAQGRIAHLVPGHDPATREWFTPLEGPLAAHAARIGAVT